MSNGRGQHDSPPAVQAEDGRDQLGRFMPGNGIGPRFQSGRSGNPSGRPAGVTYVGDWVRGQSGMTEDELRRIADDPAEPVSRRGAAKLQLDMIDPSPEVRGRAFLRVADRCEGKPGVHVDVKTTSDVPRAADIESEIARLIRDNPGLLALVDTLRMDPQALPPRG